MRRVHFIHLDFGCVIALFWELTLILVEPHWVDRFLPSQTQFPVHLVIVVIPLVVMGWVGGPPKGLQLKNQKHRSSIHDRDAKLKGV